MALVIKQTPFSKPIGDVPSQLKRDVNDQLTGDVLSDSARTETRTRIDYYSDLHSISDLELVAACLGDDRQAHPKPSSKRRGLQRAAKRLEQAGSLREFLKAAPPRLQATRELIRRALAEDLQATDSFQSPGALEAFLRIWLSDRSVECFVVLFLNAQHQLIRAETLFRGTVNQTAVYPREVAKRALELNAVAVILAHNHPSGTIEASHSDRLLTEAIKRALQTLDIRLLDHMIIGASDCLSFAQRGWI
ncbi:MAG: RadC family protein [Burkholderiales bacterium]|jgi:DNA repair protein RadC